MRIEPESPAGSTSQAAVTTPAPRLPADLAGAAPPPASTTAGRERRSLFRAFWRWHFYATVVVVPVLLVLAVTGGIYLLRFQVEPLLHADVMQVERAGQAFTQPYEAQRRAVADAYPDHTVLSMSEPRDEGRSTVFTTEAPDGAPLDVFVDPWTAQVLGALNPDTTLSGTAVRLHAELMAGRTGDVVIELAACWSIVMALTGYYLWFQGRAARRRARQARARGAALRQRHAVVGAVAGVGLLFLLVSGLPWTGVWGERAQAIATSSGTSFWSDDHGALSAPTTTLDESLPHSHAEVPWAQGDVDLPTSDDDEEVGQVANVDTAIAVADAEGLRHPMTVALPAGSDGVFSVLGFAFDAPTDERTVHVDQYDGEAVATYGYADYPVLAKVVSHGIALHEGRHFGTVNLLISLAFCAGIVFLCLSGPWMWWRRRPRGGAGLGAPRGRMPLRSRPALAVAVLALAVFLPLFGVSLAVVLLLDQLLLRRVGALQRWFAVT